MSTAAGHQPERDVSARRGASPWDGDAGGDGALARQRDAYGGIKMGSAFFGWLTATAMAVLLTAVLVAAGVAVGAGTGTDLGQVTAQASADPQTTGRTSAIILLVILFVAYYCGGYVAGRMSRFDGLKQGLAVWLWAVVIAVVLAVLAAVAGSKYDALTRLNDALGRYYRIPLNESTLTRDGLIALLAVAAVTLAGALLGGLAGMRFHRAVDRAAVVDR